MISGKKHKGIQVKDIIYNTPVSIKSINNNETIYFLVSYDDNEENREHRTLTWDNEKHCYVNGKEREDSFVIKWNMSPPYKSDLTLTTDQPYKADIWFWKAFRTDHAGYADDKTHTYSNLKKKDAKILLSKTGTIYYLLRNGDEGGQPAYTTLLYSEHVRDKMPKYGFQSPPQGAEQT